MAATSATISQFIGMPTLYQEQGPEVPVQKPSLPEKTAATIATWLAGSFVVRTGSAPSEVLEAVLSNALLIYGVSPDAAFSAGATIPTPMPPVSLFGFNHYCFDPRDRIYSINIANNSAAGATIGLNTGVSYLGDGTNGVALAAGQQYGIVRPTSGTYNNVQFLDVTNTTNKVFEIVGVDPRNIPGCASTRVLVKVIPIVIQA